MILTARRDPDVDADVVARFCLMLSLGSLLVRAMDLPSTEPDEWASFITRLVGGFRAGELDHL